MMFYDPAAFFVIALARRIFLPFSIAFTREERPRRHPEALFAPVGPLFLSTATGVCYDQREVPPAQKAPQDDGMDGGEVLYFPFAASKAP
jgi:hypothetical protein